MIRFLAWLVLDLTARIGAGIVWLHSAYNASLRWLP